MVKLVIIENEKGFVRYSHFEGKKSGNIIKSDEALAASVVEAFRSNPKKFIEDVNLDNEPESA